MANRAIDPRIAAAGGKPDNAGGGYRYLGMMRWVHWKASSVHRFTHYYGCARCGLRFKTPHAVYTHIAMRHGH